jgi:predicted RNase H-like HicB family nuclease
MNVSIKISVELPIEIEKKGAWFISSCRVLDVYSQGRSEKTAKANIAEALYAFFIGCLENGTLDDVFRACGFNKYESPRKPRKKLSAGKQDYVNVPIELLANQSNNTDHCHA